MQGNFANFVVEALCSFFRLDYDTALIVYKRVFRDNMDIFFALAMMCVFFIIFRIYLNGFTKYFIDINQGIEDLSNEEIQNVSLSPELAATEKKINDIKHTLLQRKTDAMLAEQSKNDLIVYLAHDLKTPLASVMGYLNLLHDEKDIPDELREKYLSITLNKAERLEELINEFFEIARFNLSNISLNLSIINLTLLLEQTVYEFKPMLNEKNLSLSLNMAENIMLNCDGDKLQRVFDNLLRNAVFYSYEDSPIEINAYYMENNVVIRFINHGDTIPDDRLKCVFEQFYRLDPARGTNTGGAGLGLAIAKEIVEKHNGKIEAESADNVIEFTVTIPAS